MFPRSYVPRVQRVRVRFRVRVRVRVRSRVNPKPKPNHNLSEESHSNQSQANQRRKRRYLPLPYYEKKIHSPDPMFPGHIQSGEHRTRGTYDPGNIGPGEHRQAPVFVAYGEWVNLTIVSAWHFVL